MLILSTATPKILIYISAAATLVPATGLSGTTGLRFIKPDGSIATPTNGLTELDSTNAKGWYSVQVAGGDALSTGEWVLSYQTATTAANIGIVRFMVNGPVDLQTILNTAVSSPATAGVLDVNVKNINNVVAATPGASGGLLINGANTGAISFSSTVTITGALVLTGGTTWSIDGVQFDKVQKGLLAVLGGKLSVVDNGNGTSTFTFRNQADNANVIAPIVNNSTSARTTTVTPT